MQTKPPSIANNVKLDPLESASESIAYNSGYITLNKIEPSLGLPSGYTLTQNNSVYYFPVFGIDNSLINSRKFTGVDSVVLVNKNLGYNNINPTFNVDINGTLHALSAFFDNLSASIIVPSDASNILTFDYSNRVDFNSPVFFNNNVYATEINANTLYTDFLSAKKEITTTIYLTYVLSGAYVTNNVVIAGTVSAASFLAATGIYTPYISATNATFVNLTANNTTIINTLSVGKDLYANKIYGKIDYDPFSSLYYNSKNQLSINANRNYVFAIRPSDEYSTDNINVPRSTNGDWWSDYGNVHEDPDVLKPYFKSLQPIFDYVYKNGIEGNSLTIYIDEDIIEGENKVNYFTTDSSGSYAGCTVTGNLTAAFYSTEYLGSKFPYLTAAGIKGGDFLWGYDNNSDINGVFSYIDVPPVDFKTIDVYGRWNIGPSTRLNGTSYYTLSGRQYNQAPRKISFRTYVCANPRLSFNTFTNYASTWTTPKTKTAVQGRQVAFKHDTNLSLNNLCFEFYTNSIDSTGLVFYNGQTKLSNITVGLFGKGVYSYGALNAQSIDTYINICGTTLGDPTRFTPSTWNNWSYAGYNYETPNIYPGYGLAIVGNESDTYPTLINFGPNSSSTGFINANNGAMLDLMDYNIARRNGRYTQLNSSVILDGKFNSYAYFKIGDNARIQGHEYLFSTNNLAISTLKIAADNSEVYTTPTYNLFVFDDPKAKYNFKYIDFSGTFSTLAIKYYGYANWAFNPSQKVTPILINSYLNIYNGYKDFYYNFNPTANPKSIDLTYSLNSIGYLNKMEVTTYNNQNTIYYIGVSDLIKYDQYYRLTSPFDNNKTYTLSYYSSSSR
jgi:hypothetical protein